METHGLYSNQLVANLRIALPGNEIIFSGGRIFIYLKQVVSPESELKQWLYTILEGLPEIDHPIERIQFVIYQAGSLDLFVVINPSKFDVTAVHYAIERGLNFSAPPPSPWELEPLPLNHPYYTEKGWLEKQLARKPKVKDITFDDIKDLPNVKPIIEDIRKRGIKI